MTSRLFAGNLRRSTFTLACALATSFTIGGNRVEARRPSATPSPTPTIESTAGPTPAPLPFTARIARLNEQLTTIAHDAPGTLGIAVSDPATDTHVSVHGETAFPLAGIDKLAIAVAAYHLVDKRDLNLDTIVPLQAGDVRAAHGPLALAYPQGGVSLPLWKLVHAMLIDGDDTATDLVLRAVGGPAVVQSALTGLGLAGFAIRKSEFDMAADARAQRTSAHGGDNAGTPDGVAALLAGVADQKYLSLDQSTEFLLALERAHAGDDRLRGGFPSTAGFAHETGTSATTNGVTDATNDVGLVTLPDGRRVTIVALLGASSASELQRDAVLASVGKAVYRAFVP